MAFTKTSLSLLCHHCHSKSFLGLVSRRSFFWWDHRTWGHETIEEKEMKRVMDEESKSVYWTDPEKGSEVKTRYLYTPTRITEEASMFRSYMFSKGSIPSLYEKLRRPYFALITDYDYYKYTKQIQFYQKQIESQMFIRERVMALGPDLAAAYFLCQRLCRVRFKGQDEWTELNKKREVDLPNSYQPGWYIEAIDAAESLLIYEGFQNLRNLVYLKYLDLSYCMFVDAWVLDRITGEYAESLEYLDISGCPEVDWNAIECLWRLRKLKTLVLYDLDHIEDLPLLCLMLLELFPHLDIRGVDYIDTKLLEGTEHEHLLKDLDELKVFPLPEGDLKGDENARDSQMQQNQIH